MNFKIPFHREWIMFNGLIDASKESLTHCLTKKGKGSSVALVIGGANEAMDAIPGKHKLTLKNRKGFVKIALKSGADLVPCYGFGENELFTQL